MKAKCCILIFIAASWFCYGQDEVFVMRISTENSASHVQTRGVIRFAEKVYRESSGRIDTQVYHSAELYRDKDVIQALAAERIEMAVPGTWQVDRFIPEAGILLLPQFYSRGKDYNQRVMTSPAGRAIAQKIEEALHVVIPGSWFDLGTAHIFTLDSPIRDYDDFAGKRIRVAGGMANKLRIDALGAEGLIISWPDLPEYLETRRVDGTLTTYETVRSGDLMASGIRYAFADSQYFPQYIPMISRHFWDRLPEDLQRIVTRAWEETAQWQIREAADAQEAAKRILEEQGLEIVSPSEEEIRAARQVLMQSADRIARTVGIDSELMKALGEIIED